MNVNLGQIPANHAYLSAKIKACYSAGTTTIAAKEESHELPGS